MEKKTDSTTDLGLAAALWSSGAEFVGVEPKSPRTFAFLFVSPDGLCQKLADDFWRGKLTVDAKDILDKQRSLKDVIFNKLRAEHGDQRCEIPNRHNLNR